VGGECQPSLELSKECVLWGVLGPLCARVLSAVLHAECGGTCMQGTLACACGGCACGRSDLFSSSSAA
jgi:hypothetical protein